MARFPIEQYIQAVREKEARRAARGPDWAEAVAELITAGFKGYGLRKGIQKEERLKRLQELSLLGKFGVPQPGGGVTPARLGKIRQYLRGGKPEVGLVRMPEKEKPPSEQLQFQREKWGQQVKLARDKLQENIRQFNMRMELERKKLAGKGRRIYASEIKKIDRKKNVYSSLANVSASYTERRKGKIRNVPVLTRNDARKYITKQGLNVNDFRDIINAYPKNPVDASPIWFYRGSERQQRDEVRRQIEEGLNLDPFNLFYEQE